MTKKTHHRRPSVPDMDETKEHVIAAGRELMLAAQGALRFCKTYAEESASPATRYQLIRFFSKAISVADELGKGLVSATSISSSAKKIARPFIDAIGAEMKEDLSQRRACRCAEVHKQKRAPSRQPRGKKKPAATRRRAKH